jgi:hypothetical protein
MKNGQILPQASAFLLSVTNTLVLTNTLSYYRIRRLQIRNVFVVQAPGWSNFNKIKRTSILFILFIFTSGWKSITLQRLTYKDRLHQVTNAEWIEPTPLQILTVLIMILNY